MALLVIMLVTTQACAMHVSASRNGGRGGLNGVASWYGKDYHGRQTASGSTYNMYDMTAAHRTLRFGTRVRVTHARSGRSVVVEITDRGPFVKGRVIDLSFGAARKLGMVNEGIAQVHLDILK